METDVVVAWEGDIAALLAAFESQLAGLLDRVPDAATDLPLLRVVEVIQAHAGRVELQRGRAVAAAADRRTMPVEDLRREVALIQHSGQAAASRTIEAARAFERGEYTATREAVADGSIAPALAEWIVERGNQVPEPLRGVFEVKAVRSAGQVLTTTGALERIRKAADEVDPDGMLLRHRAARTRRTAGIEPLPDGMATLWVQLPAVEAVAAWDRIVEQADRLHALPGEERCVSAIRADLMADLLLSDLPEANEFDTAQVDAAQIDFVPDAPDPVGTRRTGPAMRIVPEVALTIPVLTAIGVSDKPAHLRSYGPVDAQTAREWVGQAHWFSRACQVVCVSGSGVVV